MKRSLLIGALLVAIALLAALPPLIELRSLDSKYLGALERALGCRIENDSATLRILPLPALRLANLALIDRRAPDAEPFLLAKEASFELRPWPLLRGRIEIGAVVIDRAVLRLDRAAACAAPSPRVTNRRQGGGGGRAGGVAPPARIHLRNGELRLQPAGGKPVAIHGLELSLGDLARPPLAYRVLLPLPGLRPLSLEGLLEVDDSGQSLTLVKSRLEAPGISFGVSGSIGALEREPRIELRLRNDAFEVAPFFRLLSALGQVPKGVEVAGAMELEILLAGRLGDLSSEARALLKGVRIKNSAYLDGTLSGQLHLAAPLWNSRNGIGRLRGSGTLEVKDGVLARLDLASNVQKAAGIREAAKRERSTPFDSFRATFTLREGVLYLRGLSLRSATLKAEGSGRLHIAAGTVDLGLKAVLDGPAESSVALSAKTGARNRTGLAVPLRIHGPLGGPLVDADPEAGARL